MPVELCANRLEQVRSAVGTSRTLELADDLTARVAALLEAIGSGANAELAAEAHKTRSAAGALALLRLSDALERLEAALRRPQAHAAVATAAQAVHRAMAGGAAALREALSAGEAPHPSVLTS